MTITRIPARDEVTCDVCCRETTVAPGPAYRSQDGYLSLTGTESRPPGDILPAVNHAFHLCDACLLALSRVVDREVIRLRNAIQS